MMERLDDLQRNGLKLWQKTDDFRFGMDAVLLADFAVIRPRDIVVDLGTGTGILPLLISQKERTATFVAFEWQRELAELAQRNVSMNGLQESINVIAADYREALHWLKPQSVQAIVCNPPYAKHAQSAAKQILSRAEMGCTLIDTLTVCDILLQNKGRLFMAFPSERLLELCDGIRAHHLEPKRIRLIQSKPEREPYLALIEAQKNVKPGLRWLPVLLVRDAHGQEQPEIKHIYHSDAPPEGLMEANTDSKAVE